MLPLPPDPPPPHRTPGWVMILLFGLALAIASGVGELARQLSRPLPTVVASTSPSLSAPGSSAPAFDPTASAALAHIAAAFSTSVAPTVTPLPPTPTYAVATMIPDVICGSWVRVGETCVMPPAPLPTSTPLADCPVAPKLECIWRGTLGTPAPPAPPVNHGAPWRPSGGVS